MIILITRVQLYFRKAITGILRRLFGIVIYHRLSMKWLIFKHRCRAKEPKRIVFWIPGGLPPMVHFEGALAAALKLRGHSVHAIICDGTFIGCVKRDIHDNLPVTRWHETCSNCSSQCSAVLKALNIEHSFIGDYVSKERKQLLWDESDRGNHQDLRTILYRDIPVGVSARGSIARFLRGFPIDGNESIIRQYLYSALITAESAETVSKTMLPDRVFTSHGIYAEWGPAMQVFLRKGIKVSGWLASYLPGRVFLGHVGDNKRTYFHALSSNSWDQRKLKPLTTDEDQRLNSYFIDRYVHNRCFDMDSWKSNYLGDSKRTRTKLSIYDDRPTWAILTHMNWDSVGEWAPILYDSFDEWLFETIKVIMQNNKVQWLVKIHPCEITTNPLSGANELIKKHFPNLPDHIKIIPGDFELNPLDFYSAIDGIITAFGTGGLEAATLGKSLVLAGEAHYGRKGFSHDCRSRAEYENILKKLHLLNYNTPEQTRLARLYAYNFFIERQVPLPIVHKPNERWWTFKWEEKHKLPFQKDPFVDFICNHIVDNSDFIMNEQLIKHAESIP